MRLWLLAGLLGCGGVDDVCSTDEPAPERIDDVVGILQGLAVPVTLPCFLQALPRPLQLEATSDVFSAQPATSTFSPRIFVQSGPLVLSVVPAGPGRPLLEFGERQGDAASTVKAELHFPLVEPPTLDDPFQQVARSSGGTHCGLCHAAEREVAPGRFTSRPLRPATETLVGIDWLEEQTEACATSLTDRCAVLQSIFAHGPVEHAPLPATWGTIYEPSAL
ncbi:MAG: hypothetical protein KTR31_13530 [Myxococcales bacterium]|nr:hypothetical protein [Myxococcales bacterium]